MRFSVLAIYGLVLSSDPLAELSGDVDVGRYTYRASELTDCFGFYFALAVVDAKQRLWRSPSPRSSTGCFGRPNC